MQICDPTGKDDRRGSIGSTGASARLAKRRTHACRSLVLGWADPDSDDELTIDVGDGADLVGRPTGPNLSVDRTPHGEL